MREACRKGTSLLRRQIQCFQAKLKVVRYLTSDILQLSEVIGSSTTMKNIRHNSKDSFKILLPNLASRMEGFNEMDELDKSEEYGHNDSLKVELQ
jgi:hypothetical protein